MDRSQQGFRSAAKFGFGGQESASKPPQAICKPLGTIYRNMVLRKLFYISFIGLMACQSQVPKEETRQADDQIFAPISNKLIYLNEAGSFRQGDTIAIMDTSSLQLEKQRIRSQIRAWYGKRISAASHTEPFRLSLGHRFYLQSEIKSRQKEGEREPMVELAKNDYEIMYYQEKMRNGLKEAEQENQFIEAQIDQLEIRLEQINIEIETCFLISVKEARCIGRGPIKGRWYPQGALLMELEH